MLATREELVTQDRPFPQPTLDNRELYEAARRGELRFQRCAECGRLRHFPRPTCPDCLSRSFAWERVSGRGRIDTWTIVRGPTLPAFGAELPYAVVVEVEAVLVPVTDEITLVRFRRIRGA